MVVWIYFHTIIKLKTENLKVELSQVGDHLYNQKKSYLTKKKSKLCEFSNLNSAIGVQNLRRFKEPNVSEPKQQNTGQLLRPLLEITIVHFLYREIRATH
jgi:hypothetical protein